MGSFEVDVHRFCLENTNLNEDVVYSAITNEKTPLDSEVGVFFRCVWRTKSVMDSGGGVNMRNLQKFSESEPDRFRHLTDDEKLNVRSKLSDCELMPSLKQEETAILLKNCHTNVVSVFKYL
uniref:Uncharacterized protein n=1 Tax=Photinus pyralis TaxID=7054 RepID=A0A1Y1K568_PHOPY